MVCRRSSPKPIPQSEKCLMQVTLLMTRLIQDKLRVELACTTNFLTGPCSYLLKWFSNNTLCSVQLRDKKGKMSWKRTSAILKHDKFALARFEPFSPPFEPSLHYSRDSSFTPHVQLI